MQKTLLAGLILLFMGYYTYDVFLAEDALTKRFEVSKEANGGYTATTKLTDGSQLIETYVIDENGNPYSHTLANVSKDGGEPQIMKKGTFVPKHQ